MTIGHRVQRSTLKSSKAVRKLFPWASRLVRVDGVWVAYEAAEDAQEEHGPVCGKVDSAGTYDPMGSPKRYNPAGLFAHAKRRGDI